MEEVYLKVDEWLTFFKKYRQKKLFSLSDLVVLTGESISSLSVQLSRLNRANMLHRAARNWYENPFNTPSIEEIAMILRPPSYLSMEYALYKNDVLSQQIHLVTLVTTQLTYTYKTTSRIFEFHQMKKSLFWGYQTQGTINIADAEKALLDLIYLRYARNKELTKQQIHSLLDNMYLEELNHNKLQKYVQSFDSRTKKIIQEIEFF